MRVLVLGGTEFVGPFVVRRRSPKDFVVDEALRRSIAWERRV